MDQGQGRKDNPLAMVWPSYMVRCGFGGAAGHRLRVCLSGFAKIALSPPGLLLRGAPVFSSAGASISRARRKDRLNLTGRQKENKQVKRAPLWCKKSIGTNPWSLGPVLAEKIRLCGENGGGISIISAAGIKETQGFRPAGGESGEIYSKTANKTGLFEN